MRWLFTAAMVAFATAAAVADDPVAVLTEIQVRRGQVHVRPAGDSAWVAPRPLQALRAGDQVRVVGEGRAVLVFAGGRGTQLVTQSNSPFRVSPQASEGAGDRLRSVLGGVTSFLMGQQREKTYQSLSVRSVRAQPPDILAPRNGRVLPGALAFEWSGPERLRYRVRLVGGQGVIWEQGDVERPPLAYPATAPPLAPGGRYAWELETREHGVRRAEFEVATTDDAARVREALALLTPEGGYPPATLAVLRAGFYLNERLYGDARRELVTAIAAAPEEPALRLLLGRAYDRSGLRQLAGQEFEEAEALSAPRP